MTDPAGRDEIAAALRDAFMSSRARGGPSCPETDKLAALALSELGGDERDSVADHAVGCAGCSATLRDLMDLHEAASPEARLQPRAWTTGWRVAAAVLLIAGTALTIRTWWESAPLPPAGVVERGAPETERDVSPPDGASLSQAPPSLTCPGRPDAEQYRVAIFDAESTLIWESPGSRDPVVSIPQQVLGRFEPGRYFWRCLWLHGVETSQSPLHHFTVAEPAR